MLDWIFWFCSLLELNIFHDSFHFALIWFRLVHDWWFVHEQESMDNITLFSIITIMSFILLAPVTIFMEGVKFTPAYLQSVVSSLYRKKMSKKTNGYSNCMLDMSSFLICLSVICDRDWMLKRYTLGLFLLRFASMPINR